MRACLNSSRHDGILFSALIQVKSLNILLRSVLLGLQRVKCSQGVVYR